jgi:hypothetical protein
MNEGYIKLYRSIEDNWLWKKKPFSPGQAWIDILLETNHEDHKIMIKGVLFECKRGQSLNSVLTWQKRWGWSRQKVRTFLYSLKNDSMIEQNTTNKTTILTVCNYDNYQNIKPYKQPALNQHLTTNNNERNIYNIYIEKDHLSITWDEFNKLADEFGEIKADEYIKKVLNYRKNSKYKSLYLTALNWLKKDVEKQKSKFVI